MSTLATSLGGFLGSSIGKKWIVALSGLVLLGFLAGHLTGNLLVYVGPEAMNGYAEFLHHFLHGTGVWIARIVLLVALVAHVVFTIQLTIANRKARPQRYAIEVTQNASKGSKWMALSGLLILCFIVFHLLHYTVRIDTFGFGDIPLDSEGRFDVYKMMIAGFSNVWVSLFYIISIALLCLHLSHGVTSLFQTLGLTTPKTKAIYDVVGMGFSAAIFVGFASIPLSVLFGWVK